MRFAEWTPGFGIDCRSLARGRTRGPGPDTLFFTKLAGAEPLAGCGMGSAQLFLKCQRKDYRLVSGKGARSSIRTKSGMSLCEKASHEPLINDHCR
jgi:hypothetical protein